eukprot:2032312-Amphidinium_carterae.2
MIHTNSVGHELMNSTKRRSACLPCQVFRPSVTSRDMCLCCKSVSNEALVEGLLMERSVYSAA